MENLGKEHVEMNELGDVILKLSSANFLVTFWITGSLTCKKKKKKIVRKNFANVL